MPFGLSLVVDESKRVGIAIVGFVMLSKSLFPFRKIHLREECIGV